MTEFRGYTEAGEEVVGNLFKYKYCDKIYIVLNEYSADELQNDSYLFYQGFAWHEVPPHTIAQFTGRLDKNKKKICGSIEIGDVMSKGGDKIKGRNGFGEIQTTEVYYNDGGFYPLCEGEFCWAEIEVIGPQFKE